MNITVFGAGRCGHRPLRYPSGATRHLPFQGRLRDSSALTGTSSRRGGSGEQCSPLRWVVAGWGWILPFLFLGRVDVDGKPYEIPLPCRASLTEPSPLSLRDISPHCGESPFSRGTRDSSAASFSPYNNSGRISAAVVFYAMCRAACVTPRIRPQRVLCCSLTRFVHLVWELPLLLLRAAQVPQNRSPALLHPVKPPCG